MAVGSARISLPSEYRTRRPLCRANPLNFGTMLTDLDGFGRTFLAVGPGAVLLAGTGVLVVTAIFLRGRRMWWALAAGPIVIFVVAVAATRLNPSHPDPELRQGPGPAEERG